MNSFKSTLAPQMDEIDRFYAEVGGLVRKARSDRSVTQEDLGSAVALTRTSITNIEKGRQRLPLHTFAKIAAALGVTVAELLPSSPSKGDDDLAQQLSARPKDERDWIQAVVLNATRRESRQ
jgi:transcriptional regulator with XRE-family HTH domain